MNLIKRRVITINKEEKDDDKTPANEKHNNRSNLIYSSSHSFYKYRIMLSYHVKKFNNLYFQSKYSFLD